jgi:hypothetical protein
MDITRAEPFFEPGQDSVGRALHRETDAHKACALHRGEQLVIKGGRAHLNALKSRTRFCPDERFANGQGMVVGGVEHVIYELDVMQSR